MLSRSRLLAVAVTLCVSACSDPVDKAAKQRIFSPEEPPKAKLAASEPLDADKIAEDANLTFRVLTMGPAEAFERIGPFRYSATASFEWTYGKQTLSLTEKRTLEQASVSEYSLHTENSRDAGLDVIHLSDRTFARSKYHKFRERVRDRGQSDLLREDVFGALHSAQTLLGNRLALEKGEREEVGGRGARRYRFMIAKDPLRPLGPDFWKLPELKYPAGGPDAATKRRADFANLRAPKSVEGSLWVDVETGVPLKALLTATVAAPGEEKDEATLVLKVTSELKPAEGLALAAPAEFLPDEDRPAGIAGALGRFEIERADGGTPAPQAKPADPEEAAEE